jgi:hypothetical protein
MNNEVSISFYTDNTSLDNKFIFSNYVNSMSFDEEYQNIYDNLLNDLNKKNGDNILSTEILYGNYLKAFINIYIAYSINIKNNTKFEYKLFVPSNYFSFVEEFSDFTEYVNSPFFKTNIFEFIAKKNVRKLSILPLLPITNSKKKSCIDIKKISRLASSLVYTLLIFLILKFKKIKNIVAIRYHVKISKSFLVDENTLNIKFDKLLFNNVIKKVIYKEDLNELSLSDFFIKNIGPWVSHNQYFVRIYLRLIGLKKPFNKLITDSYQIDNLLFKQFVVSSFENYGTRSDIIAHGGSFFLNPGSWIYLNTPIYKYYGNGSLSYEQYGIKIHSGFSGRVSNNNKIFVSTEKLRWVIIYLYPHYQFVRKNISESISRMHFSDIEKLVESLIQSNYKVVLKPHNNSGISSIFYPEFIERLKFRFPQIHVGHHISPEIFSHSETLHLFSYLSTGWLEKINENIKSVCFNPFYLDIFLSPVIKEYINSQLLNRCYFEHLGNLINTISIDNFPTNCNVDGIFRYGQIKEYLKSIYEVDE